MSGRSSAMVCVDFVTRLRAIVFGRYPSCSTAASIAARVAGAIWPVPLRARDTVAGETRHVVDRGPRALHAAEPSSTGCCNRLQRQQRQRVEGLAAAPQLEVQVRTRAPAGAARDADRLPL